MKPKLVKRGKCHRSHRMAWVEKDHNDHLVSTPLLCAGSPTTRPGCPEPHPAWPWVPPGMEALSWLKYKEKQTNKKNPTNQPKKKNSWTGNFSFRRAEMDAAVRLWPSQLLTSGCLLQLQLCAFERGGAAHASMLTFLSYKENIGRGMMVQSEISLRKVLSSQSAAFPLLLCRV